MTTYGPQSGDSLENAITITGAKDEKEAVDSEYIYIEKNFGPLNQNWKRTFQALIEKNGRRYDQLTIEFSDGTKRDFYFDITDFFGQIPL